MSRKSNGDGNFRKLSSGNWNLQIMIGYTPEGKKNIQSFTASTKSECKDMARIYINTLNSGHIVPDNEALFTEWSNKWYDDYKTQVQPSTYSGYKYTLKILNDYFSNCKLCKIKQIEVNSFLNHLSNKGYSVSAISKCKAMLIQIFTFAEENDIIDRNPALRAKTLRTLPTAGKPVKKQKKDAFTEKEVEAIINGVPNNLVGNSIPLLCGTGMRVQELLALTDKDISEDASSIDINKAIEMVDGIPVLGPPKSALSVRLIPVPLKYRKYALFLKNHGGKDYIFESRREDKLTAIGTYRKKYYRIIESIPGVRRLTPHCTRHTYATILQSKKIPIDIIQKLAGHADAKTTEVYTHTDFETLASYVSVLDVQEEGAVNA